MQNYWTRSFRRADAATVAHFERHAHLPRGCDYQGRHPQAAEACTDLCAVEDDDTPAGSARGLVAYFVVTLLALASAAIYFWPQIAAAFEEIL